jgi:hypothetical protein
MLGASLVFLTPAGAIAMAASVLPLAALALAARRERRAREALGLRPPPPARRVARIAGLAAVPILLGLAATQPALRTTDHARVRTDAQAFFVMDVTRSMGASGQPGGTTRLERARRLAIRLRDSIPEVPAGIATLTDRALPSLFPTPDPAQFRLTMERAIGLDQPPPTITAVVATNIGAVGALGTQNFFSPPPAGKHRVVVLLTDGESRGFDPGPVAQALRHAPGVHLVVVRVGSEGESIWDGSTRESSYHPDPNAGAKLESLASATGTKVYDEGSTGAAARAVEAAVGSGPTVVLGTEAKTRTLAPYLALLALVPLLLVLPRIRLRGLGAAFRLSAGTRLGARLRRPARRRPMPAPSGGGQ